MKNFLLTAIALLFCVAAHSQTSPYVRYELQPQHVLYFREAPDSRSPVTDTMSFGLVNSIYVVDSSDPRWMKVEMSRSVPIESTGRLQQYETVNYIRYVERSALEEAAVCEYTVNADARIVVRDAPNGAVADTLSGYSTFKAIGPRSARWVKINYITYKTSYNRKGKTSMEQVNHTGYVAQSDFAERAAVVEIDLSDWEPDAEDRLEEARDKVKFAIENRIDTRAWFPWVILCGILLYFIMARLCAGSMRLQIMVKFLILSAIFFIELFYIVVMGYGFWFCEPDRVGWLKAILFTLASLGVLVVQYNMFFGLLEQVMQASRHFNTSVGIVIFTLITAVMFVYALFTGGLTDTQNTWLFYIVLGTQVVQMVISAVQLRSYPLYALMMVIFIPLGTFAIITVALSIFKYLVFIAIILLALGGLGSGRSGAAASSGEEGSLGSARNCPHFGSDHLCDFYGTPGSKSQCGLMTNGKCQHGYWHKQ